VVRVHPGFLETQKLPYKRDLNQLWNLRYESILAHEKHLAENGTVILKFWLNVSKEEQRLRFLARIDDLDKNWKFSEGDVRERDFWDDYMLAYRDALNATSRPWAPWYSIPADDKPFMRECVAEIIVQTLASLDLRYPSLPVEDKQKLANLRSALEQRE
jgi:polyphosphate kinase 2 (PPK2 family)